MMRVGAPVYACNSGLGLLAKAFIDNGIVTDPFVIHHAHHETQPWHPGRPSAHIRDLGRPDVRRQLDSWLSGLDVLLAFETFFDNNLVTAARRAGVKVVLMPMHECHYNNTPAPDEYWCPSLLDMEVFSAYDRSFTRPRPFDRHESEGVHGSGAVFTPVPVGSTCATCAGTGVGACPDVAQYVEVPGGCPRCNGTGYVGPVWRKRERAEVFVHNAGHGGLKGRNGTAEFIKALQHVKSPARFILRTQRSPTVRVDVPSHVDFAWVNGTVDHAELWRAGDVFLFPESFNGLSLPIQEARAAGMLVMCGDRFPMNSWLPTKAKTGSEFMSFKERRGEPLVPIPGTVKYEPHYGNPLIPVASYREDRIGGAYPVFQRAEFDPRTIAEHIDHWFGRNIAEYSDSGREWAQEHSWAVLGPRYKALLESLVNS
jgi:glycosyltransferase involved in cell wall biosynthesis